MGNIISFQDKTGMYVEIPFYYYPGYRVLLDDIELQAERGEYGISRAALQNLESGKIYHLRAFFAEPTMWKIADWVSVFTLSDVIISAKWKVLRKKQILADKFEENKL